MDHDGIVIPGNSKIDLESISENKEILNSLEIKRKARQIQVSTEDSEVKAYLRQLGEPICLFGEDAADRRERLKYILAVRGESAIRKRQEDGRKPTDETDTLWYHEGPSILKDVRQFVLEYSLPRAKRRLNSLKEYCNTVNETQRKAKVQEVFKQIKSTSLECSQIGDSRPLSYCSFSPDGQQLAAASWSGLCSLWSIPSCEKVTTLRGHEAQVSCIEWNPKVGFETNVQIALVSSSQDGSVKLWSLDCDTPIADIEGHAPHRVARVGFHPSGRLLATCCFDHSWRLWDLESAEEILHQEGHSKPVYCVAFHPDGSLAVTGGLDSFGRVWDLRTGRCIVFLDGHLEGILTVDVADNGYHVATGSEDHSVKLWDLRTQKCLYTIPAHTGVVSSVRFQPGSNHYIMSSSFDKTSKLWGHPVCTPLKILTGHEGRVTCCDISPDSKYMATSSFDRTFKLWMPEM